MKINFQKLMRVLPSLITVVVIIALCCLPAFAAGTEKDIFDYAQISVDGFTKVVTVVFPANGFDITAWQNSFAYESVPLFTHQGNSATFDFTGVNAGARPRRIVLTLAPLGEPIIPFRSQPYNGFYLDVSELPSSAVCSVDVAFYCNEVDGNATRTVEMFFVAGTYNNSSGNYSGGDKLRMTLQHPESNIWIGHYDWSIGDNSKFYIPEVYATVDSSNELTGRWQFAVDNFSIITTIDALKELEKNTAETNRILEEVREQLNINNQNWQDFLDGKAEWQDIVDSSTDKVEDAVGDMNEIGDALATIPKPEIDIDTLVPDELAGQQYLNYTAALARLWENPIISTVAYIMGCLLIFSYLLFGERG